MSTHLEKIMANTLLRMTARKQAADMGQLEALAAAHQPRGFAANLRSVSATGPAIISEVKKASPSRGIIRADFQPEWIARRYQSAGAAAISVLTDEDYFQGSLADLTAVSRVVSIPVPRKDFILDPFQILEARAAGADAILLIVAAHPDAVLAELAAEASRRGLDVLCEVHNLSELERAVTLGFEVIGVNSRDLKTLEVKPETHIELAAAMPTDLLRVAESGIRDSEDIGRLLEAGYNAFLVGETLMREPDPAVALAQLIGKAAPCAV